jgi:hypothetical protein
MAENLRTMPYCAALPKRHAGYRRSACLGRTNPHFELLMSRVNPTGSGGHPRNPVPSASRGSGASHGLNREEIIANDTGTLANRCGLILVHRPTAAHGGKLLGSSLAPRRQHRLRCRRVLLDPIDGLPTEVCCLGDGTDSEMLVEHCAHDVELRAHIRRLPAFIPDLGLLLGMGNASLPRGLDGFSRCARWYIAHFDDGRADKEAHLAAIQETGGKSEYRHDGFTSFFAVYELLSNRGRKVKAALKPAEKGQTKAKAVGPRNITQKQKLVFLQNDNAKLVNVVLSLDPKHPVLSEINRSILPESAPTPDLGGRCGLAGSTKKATTRRKAAASKELGDQADGDRLAVD